MQILTSVMKTKETSSNNRLIPVLKIVAIPQMDGPRTGGAIIATRCVISCNKMGSMTQVSLSQAAK
ncbi:unnamed protein product [Clavelina lepadiformis]|uniref:Uncharacterized protein n=1 Tax=Clavelina lepadiformis TaxID=159417 RepID=A0ABP0F0E8_CLALP